MGGRGLPGAPQARAYRPDHALTRCQCDYAMGAEVCCQADEQAPRGPVVVYDHQGLSMPFTDDQAERVDWAEGWARVHGRTILATATDDAQASTSELIRPGFERVVALLADADGDGGPLVLVHRPEALDPDPRVRAVLAARVRGRIITTTGEPVSTMSGETR